MRWIGTRSAPVLIVGLVVGLVVVVGCRSEPAPVAAGTATAAVTASGAPTSAPAASSAGAMAAPPPFATLTKLVVRTGQGGPAMMRCSGVVSEIELDLAADTYRYGYCPMSAEGSTPLTVRTGKITAADRSALEKAWDAATLVTARCASDAGIHSVEATFRGATTKWSCKEPQDLSARDLDHALFAIVTPKP